MVPKHKSARAAVERYDTMETVRRAFDEFLTLPTSVIAVALLLAAGSYALDHSRIGWLEPSRAFLQELVFSNASATADLLSTVASGIITVTSITISLLIVALQQSAGSLTAEIYDQFLRRRHNQFYFGFFVGLALFSLVTLGTVNEAFNPVFGATLAFLLTVVALYVLIVLLYTTINQMRPAEVIGTIKRHILTARESQLQFIRRTRSSPRAQELSRFPVTAERSGFVSRVDLDALEAAAAKEASDVEFILLVSIGSFVSFGDTIAEVRAKAPAQPEQLVDCLKAAVRLERQQGLVADPGDGIEQLEMIAWTSISTAKSDPTPGLMVIQSLRDVLARWVAAPSDIATTRQAPVVYTDTVPGRLMDAFESLTVVSTESMQHQTFAEVLRTFSVLFSRLTPDQQRRAEDIILRALSGLGDHILTGRLEEELASLTSVLCEAGRTETAAAVQEARDILARSVGRIGSRATRLEAE